MLPARQNSSCQEPCRLPISCNTAFGKLARCPIPDNFLLILISGLLKMIVPVSGQQIMVVLGSDWYFADLYDKHSQSLPATTSATSFRSHTKSGETKAILLFISSLNRFFSYLNLIQITFLHVIPMPTFFHIPGFRFQYYGSLCPNRKYRGYGHGIRYRRSHRRGKRGH